MRSLITLLTVVFVSFGCKPGELRQSRGFIIGTDDIRVLDSEVSAVLDQEIINSSVLIGTWLESGKVKFCSGTVINGKSLGLAAEYHVVTNHHCFAKQGLDKKSTPEVLPEACDQTRVFAGFHAANNYQSQSMGCLEDSLKTSFPGDVAVLTLDTGDRGEDAPPIAALELWDESESIDLERSLVTVHYPDQEEDKKQPAGEDILLPTAAASVDDCRFKGTFPRDQWPLDRTLPYGIAHSCDLLRGSSGSALVDRETRKVVGVNWGGIEISSRGQSSRANVATSSGYVRAFLTGDLEAYMTKIKSQGLPTLPVQAPGPSSEAAQESKDKMKISCGTLALKEGKGGLGMWIGWFVLGPLVFAGLWVRQGRMTPKQLTK